MQSQNAVILAKPESPYFLCARHLLAFALIACACIVATTSFAQTSPVVAFDRPAASDFAIAANARAAAIYVAPQNPETVRVAAEAFASDVEQVTGIKPRILASLAAPLPANLILVGVLGHSPEIDALVAAHKLDASAVAGKWESAVTATLARPMPGVRTALVIAGSDRRGAAYALFTLSRQMGVSPWTWWADVPVAHHAAVYVRAGVHLQPQPSVQYRGIFINDEDWGMRPWASKKMDPTVDNGKGNFGPHTYARIFELLLRLHANSLWPAMHPGSLPFNAVPENAKFADKWGIVMGASHSEALLRNNVGEWNEKTDGPWNYQLNAPAMNAYWDKRLVENGKYENFYTVGLRGVHDSGLEATGSLQVKAKLVEDVMTAQRKLLADRANPDVAKVPQIIWLYKESLDLYRVGMKVPDDVTLGWTDDNYGYIRELPNAAEQARPGGNGVYYHVSYWGAPHDYLWLCSTPPALIREEMTKAFDHNARKYWILNVGDLKPAELDIDYFMQLAWDEPGTSSMSQRDFLTQWSAEQFPITNAGAPSFAASPQRVGYRAKLDRIGPPSIATQIADILTRYYALNFIRKPEFMGFNGYNDTINRTAFSPLAWGVNGEPDQNRSRIAAWDQLRSDEADIATSLPPQYASAFFELVGYPVEASAAMNEKFLYTDRSFADVLAPLTTIDVPKPNLIQDDAAKARAAYETIQSLTARYNSLEKGKWDGIMSSAPRERHVFEMPRTWDEKTGLKFPDSWMTDETVIDPTTPNLTPGFIEQHCAVSINAAHFTRSYNGNLVSHWNILADLGISGSSVVYGDPGRTPLGPIMTVSAAQRSSAQGLFSKGGIFPWLEYDFTTTSSGDATLALHLLPTFAIDSGHHLRYAVSLDNGTPIELDASGADGHGPNTATWSANVLRNSAIANVPLGPLTPGKHTLRLLYRDPGVVFEHLVITFPGAPPAYPVPPETISPSR